MNLPEIKINQTNHYSYLPIISMISISFLISAMIFTYRIIEFGPFLTPGGVIPFAMTYLIAGIVTEVYGYKNARKLIFGNFICIFIFNITINFLLKLPVPSHTLFTDAYAIIFGQALFVMCIYSVGFLFGDLANAFFVSKWWHLLRGKYFAVRLVGASIIGQVSFSIIVIPSLYLGSLSLDQLVRQFLTTIIAKLTVIVILSYPSAILVRILKKLENIKQNEPTVMYNPFAI